MNTLQLNFRDKDKAQACVNELRDVSPVEFTTSQHGGPDPRDILTKPEYLEINGQVTLVFKTKADCDKFAATTACRLVYDKYAC